MVGSEATPPARARVWAAAFGIAIATLAVYAPVRDYPFLTWDDIEYVEQNPNLREPLGLASVARAFGEKYESNWIPLTWISLHVDAALFGIDPAIYHVENALLHLATALVLLFAFARATGSVGASAFAAGVFALHPLHVESVAWVAQRKDCLSGLFFALAVAAHLRIGAAAAPSRARLVAVWLAGGCAMLAKPVAVMLPIALLLLDAWPLRRIGFERASIGRRLLEKAPLFAMAVLVGVLTVLAQRNAGSIELLQIPVSWRVMNALWNYSAYLGMAVWPSGLAFYYTWPLDEWLAWKAGVSLLAIVGLGLAAAWAARFERAVLVGLLWYGLLLLPVVGFVQVGMQGRADRYMFWPLFGLALSVAFGVRALVSNDELRRRLAAGVGAAVLVAFALASSAQLSSWQSGLTLYARALEVTDDNFFAHWALASELIRADRADEAGAHYEEAIRLRPRWFHPRRDLGRLLLRRGDLDGAERALAAAVILGPGEPVPHALLVEVLLRAGRPTEATRALDHAIASVPSDERDRFIAMRAAIAANQPAAGPNGAGVE
jgi:tetratricopeptide (TPR) repeat protein